MTDSTKDLTRLEWSDMCIKAFNIALKYHSKQKDKSGMTYFWHPLRVSNMMKGWQLQVVAILHDIVEDTPETLESLKEQGIDDLKVLAAIDCLTKREGESYRKYLKRVKKNPEARLVKLADINDNMSVERLSYMKLGSAIKMLIKYWAAMRYLRNIDTEDVLDTPKVCLDTLLKSIVIEKTERKS